jgi:indolepyruvate ferredoxin oxidoreductase beta subunit
MDFKIILAGLGGEGIIFMTRVLVEGFYQSGHPVISTETHGMAMRGGSVVSQIKIGDYQSPMICHGEADLLVATSEEEVQRNLHFLKKEGLIIINTPKPSVYSIDASAVARQLGNVRGGNLVLLGFALAHIVPTISLKPFLEVIKNLTPERFVTINQKAFLIGWRKALRGDSEHKGEEQGNHAARES